MNRFRSAAVTLILLAAVPAGAQQPDPEIEVWLDRMNLAVEQVNYRGTFVHVVDGMPETMRIVHRYADGVVREKISSGADTGREILSTEDSVRSTFPEDRLVVVEHPEHQENPLASPPSYTDRLHNYYQMTTFAKGFVAGRDTQVVSIRPLDEYRYGYLLWLDQDTALPLRMDIRDETARVIESILYTEIEILDSIPELAVAPNADTDGFTMMEPMEPEFDEPAGREIWAATRLPNGFMLSMSRQTLLAGSRYPVQHLVYTDGLATVSVFIAHPLSEVDVSEGFSRRGGTNAYSLRIDGRVATAMGEVPSLTVQRIATSLNAR